MPAAEPAETVGSCRAHALSLPTLKGRASRVFSVTMAKHG